MYQSKYFMLLSLIGLALLAMAAPFIGAVSGPDQSLAVPLLVAVSTFLAVFAVGMVVVEIVRKRRTPVDDSDADSTGSGDEQS